MKNKIIAILIGAALALTTIICAICTYNPTPSLVQDTFPASTEQKFIYENSSNGPIVEVSDDSTYYELRTRFGDVQITDIGTQNEIDSLRPLRSKEVVKIYNKLKFLNK